MKSKIKRHAKAVFEAISGSSMVYTFGNGGSSSIAEHMACDWMKGSNGRVKVTSLSSNGALLSAIGNDMGYERTCDAQLDWLQAEKGQAPVLVLISSSGKSPNIVEAVNFANRTNMLVVGFSGFGGGSLRRHCNISVHIDAHDYGVVEDYHSNVMHEVARMLKAAAA